VQECDRPGLDLADRIEIRTVVPLVQVHIQEWFQQDAIELQLDDRVVFSGSVTSSRAGLAAWFDASLQPGEYRLTVRLLSKQETAVLDFSVADTLYIGVGYDVGSGEHLSFRTSRSGFTYH
jgi:hypothetical protein